MSGSDWGWLGHHTTLRTISISGFVKAEEPIRIGKGREPAPKGPTDLTVLKFKIGERELPVIPGSSWKGLFRAAAVRIASSYGVKVCMGVGQSTCLSGKDFEILEKEKLPSEDEISRKISLINDKACILCKIFGSPGYLSHVFFGDSFPENSVSIGYRTMVAIDRRTGTSYPGALFTVEYVEPGAVFNFEMRAINLPNYALGLLGEIFGEIQQGVIRIGGLKSRGFGRISFQNLKVKISGIKSIENGKLIPLDPLDEEVEFKEDFWELVKELVKVWENVSRKLQKD
ncbi:MAG: CRISPR-associated RAMP protein [Candidatus Aenigmatarchaeota archaeon]|nr:MAG: CRISPR-associated RAMP protein [Candidatus Aenigmarchaeota archaeon]